MALLRIYLDMAFPVPLSPELASKVDEVKAGIRWLKARAYPLPAENTPRAKYHICHHDEIPPKPCEPEKDI